MDQNHDREIHAEQVKLLYANAPAALIAIIVNAPILAAVQWTVISHEVLLAWLAFMIALTGSRAALVRAYRRASPPLWDPNRWWTRYLAGIALSGVGWGAAGFLLFPDASPVHQLFLIFVLGGMTAGAVTAHAAKMEAFLAFALPALLPLIARLLLQGDALNLAMAGMVALFAVLLVVIARKQHATILTSLNLRFENRDLIRSLTTEINERKLAEKEQVRLIAQLQEAMAKIKILQGILPICSHCKKIRDDQGNWRTIEAYVRDHSDATFSHGICPECRDKFF